MGARKTVNSRSVEIAVAVSISTAFTSLDMPGRKPLDVVSAQPAAASL